MNQSNVVRTKQEDTWRGQFGKEYSERNRLDAHDLDRSYEAKYGIRRSALNQFFLSKLPKSTTILEVGCNLGNQLILLHEMGFENLTGIEINEAIAQAAQARVPWAVVRQGSALQIPFADESFECVFTSGLLIHINPQDLAGVMKEIHRCSKQWIWGFEYYSPSIREVPYRGNDNLLWKADYSQLYLENSADLELIAERKVPYLDSENVDSMFLLRKKGRS